MTTSTGPSSSGGWRRCQPRPSASCTTNCDDRSRPPAYTEPQALYARGRAWGKGPVIADDPALVAFCERLYPQVVGTLTLVVGDRMIAEELAQETFVTLWQRWDRVSSLGSPAGWVHHVAMNRARSSLRRRAAARRALRRLEPDVDAFASQPDPDVAIDVRLALDALPRRQREALVLRYFAGLDVSETARVMGCPEGTVTSLCRRAREAMRVDLATQVETP